MGSNIQDMLQFTLDSIVKEDRSIPFHQLQHILDDINILPLNIPFIISNKFVNYQLMDRFQIPLQQFFTFKHSSSYCCKLRPDPDETVVHIRGFLTEMPRAGKLPKYTELNAKRAANELLSH